MSLSSTTNRTCTWQHISTVRPTDTGGRGVPHFLTLFPLSPSCRGHLLTHDDHFKKSLNSNIFIMFYFENSFNYSVLLPQKTGGWGAQIFVHTFFVQSVGLTFQMCSHVHVQCLVEDSDTCKGCDAHTSFEIDCKNYERLKFKIFLAPYGYEGS